MKLSPIVIFAYNRPHYLKETLDALSKNQEAKDSIIYIYCDGAKPNASEKELLEINKVRGLAKQKNWGRETIVEEADSNQGLSKAIICGVNEVLAKHDTIIVLEDDLVTSPFFLAFMNEALIKYSGKEEVASVVGYNYPLQFVDDGKETYFLNNSDCLGWATWKRGWALFEENAEVLVEKIESQRLMYKFNFENQYPYLKMLRSVASGKVNSWAIRWYASTFINNKLTLFPKKSLVRHIGNVGSNTKADNSDVFGWEISADQVKYFETELSESQENRQKLSKHFKKFNRRRLSIYSIKYALDRIFKIRIT